MHLQAQQEQCRRTIDQIKKYLFSFETNPILLDIAAIKYLLLSNNLTSRMFAKNTVLRTNMDQKMFFFLLSFQNVIVCVGCPITFNFILQARNSEKGWENIGQIFSHSLENGNHHFAYLDTDRSLANLLGNEIMEMKCTYCRQEINLNW